MHSFIQNAFTEHLAVLGKEDNTAEERTVPAPLNEPPNLMAHSLSPGSSPALGLISFPTQPMGASLTYLFGCPGSLLWHMGCSLFHVGSFFVVHGLSSCSTQAQQLPLAELSFSTGCGIFVIGLGVEPASLHCKADS